MQAGGHCTHLLHIRAGQTSLGLRSMVRWPEDILEVSALQKKWHTSIIRTNIITGSLETM